MTAALGKAIEQQVARYKPQGFEVKGVISDGEGGIAALEPVIKQKGITLHPAGPGQHVPEIENKTKQKREGPRKLSTLQGCCGCCSHLVGLLLCFANQHGAVLQSGDHISPRERFPGRMIDYQ